MLFPQFRTILLQFFIMATSITLLAIALLQKSPTQYSAAIAPTSTVTPDSAVFRPSPTIVSSIDSALVTNTPTAPPLLIAPSASTTVLSSTISMPSLWVERDLPHVPVLMYHYIRVIDKKQDPLGFRLSVTPERFTQQLAWLHENGYQPMRMDALAECFRGQTDCPTKPVALTFDDGYEDSATEALPILKRYKFPATFYIVHDFVGTPGYMSWDQIKLLRDSGMEIGSHSLSHSDLAALNTEKARREIVLSRMLLEQKLNIPIHSFSYPAGSYTPLTTALVRRAGYTNAVTSAPLTGLHNLYKLQRRRVLGGETIAGFPWYMTPPSAEKAAKAVKP